MTTCEAHIREEVLDAATERTIRVRAAQLARRPGFGSADVEDIEQEFRLALLRAAHRFDPNRGKWSTFVRVILDGKCQDLIRFQLRERRAAGRVAGSLDNPLGSNGQSPTLADALVQPDPTEQIQLQLDMAEFIQSLPDDLRSACRELLECPSSFARTPRKIIDALRERLEAAGLDAYLVR